jgi:hypothetical protein
MAELNAGFCGDSKTFAVRLRGNTYSQRSLIRYAIEEIGVASEFTRPSMTLLVDGLSKAATIEAATSSHDRVEAPWKSHSAFR